MTKEELQAIRDLMREELEPVKQDIADMKNQIGSMQSEIAEIKEDISTIKEDIEIIKEDVAITRDATNTLLDWADEAAFKIEIPLFKKPNEHV